MKFSLRNFRTHDSRRAQQAGTARIAPLLAILFLIALGAAALPQYQDHEHDRDHDRDHDRFGFITVAREQFARDFGGGHGGRPAPDAQCEPGFVAVGFHVQTGEYFNEAWLDCSPIRPDGWLGDEHRMTGRTGSPGGRPVHDAYCPEHFALRGLRGRAGASIDEAVGACSPLREIAERRGRPQTQWTQSVTRPNPGGRPVAADCPPGSVVTGLRSMSGEYMDHLWLLCSELRPGR